MLHKLIPTRWWTRRCDGRCGDKSVHDSRLTWFGRRALGLYDPHAAESCTVPDCKNVAEYDCWGQLFEHRGLVCWQHAHDQAGCLCNRCLSQTAIRKLPVSA